MTESMIRLTNSIVVSSIRGHQQSRIIPSPGQTSEANSGYDMFERVTVGYILVHNR
jgi:hypothetical protein